MLSVIGRAFVPTNGIDLRRAEGFQGAVCEVTEKGCQVALVLVNLLHARLSLIFLRSCSRLLLWGLTTDLMWCIVCEQVRLLYMGQRFSEEVYGLMIYVQTNVHLE